METKNSVVIIGALALILGLVGGYFAAGRAYAPLVTKCAEGTMSSAMHGMTVGLSGKTGDEMDRAFLDEMIVHHKGAVEMAHALLGSTKRPELVKMGNDIMSVQTKEIEMMEEWRSSWFGN